MTDAFDDVFITYKSERRAAAEHLAEIVRLHGYSVWFDYHLVKGRDFGRQIDHRIRSSKALIALWCARAVASEWVHEEVDLAAELGILLPVKIEECSLPAGNRRRDYVDLTAWDGAPRSHSLDPLWESLARLTGRYPTPDYQRLVEYERTWRRFGAPSLRQFALDARLDGVERNSGSADRPSSTDPIPSPSNSAARFRSEGRIKVDAPPHVHGAPEGWFLPGNGKSEWFKDHQQGPEMVVVPAGCFLMGSPECEPMREYWLKGTESPQHEVVFDRPFAVGRHAVTRGQFAEFARATAYQTKLDAYVLVDGQWQASESASWQDPGFPQDDNHPVVCIAWDDAKAYAAWLARTSGKPYRLLSEAEREYVTRAGTVTPFWWGQAITPNQANYDGNADPYPGGGAKGAKRSGTVPVSSFNPNPWGLYNVHGNAMEWCEDVFHLSYTGAPTDGTPWSVDGEPFTRVLRGGCWSGDPHTLRSADRTWYSPDNRSVSFGFRVARAIS
ncbi:MAG: SUMF1/EgtB/PvdO family nonheme iron enzyme [Hyphomicrobiaceae bacterium]